MDVRPPAIPPPTLPWNCPHCGKQIGVYTQPPLAAAAAACPPNIGTVWLDLPAAPNFLPTAAAALPFKVGT
jgi:hypothetical protein